MKMAAVCSFGACKHNFVSQASSPVILELFVVRKPCINTLLFRKAFWKKIA
jgi:hypothetical protein